MTCKCIHLHTAQTLLCHATLQVTAVRGFLTDVIKSWTFEQALNS